MGVAPHAALEHVVKRVISKLLTIHYTSEYTHLITAFEHYLTGLFRLI